MSSDRPSLRGIDLCKHFGSGETLTTALHNVSFEVRGGELSLVMGPSGSGKSTLLAVLSGLQRPDGGRVLLHETDLWRMSPAERRRFRLRHFGFIFQGYNLFPTLTVREQLEMVVRWGEGAPRREAARRTGDMLERLGLRTKGEMFPAQLSGGEKQRVAIGRALIKKPAFCFGDEPTSSLDWAHHGINVVELLMDAARKYGATVVIVTHDDRIAKHARPERRFHLEDGCLTEPRTGEPNP